MPRSARLLLLVALAAACTEPPAAPADAAPPSIVGTDPAAGATDVALLQPVVIRFSEPVEPLSVTSETLRVEGNGVPIEGTLLPGGTTIVFTPRAPWAAATTFTATLAAGVRDLAGNATTSPFSFSFTTVADTEPPRVLETEPADGATDVPLNTPLRVRFSEPLAPATVHSESFLVADGAGLQVPAAASTEGPLVLLIPETGLVAGERYTVWVTTTVTDLAGNRLQDARSWSFRTEGDVAPPRVVETAPAAGGTEVPVASSVVAVFSERIGADSVTAETFVLEQEGTPVAGQVAVFGNTAVFTPSEPLSYDARYEAAVLDAADLAGNRLAEELRWSFRTASDRIAPTVVETVPAPDATAVDAGASVSVVFSERLAPASVGTGALVLVSDAGQPVAGRVELLGATLRFVPERPLAWATAFTAIVSAQLRDLSGNALGSNHSWSFRTTHDPAAPSVVGTRPEAGEVYVPAASSVTVAFSKAMDAGTLNASTFSVRCAGMPVAGAVRSDGDTATFAPTSPLPGSTGCTATVTTSARDRWGIALRAEHRFSFATFERAPTGGLTALAQALPASGGGPEVLPGRANLWDLAPDFALDDGGDDQMDGALQLFVGAAVDEAGRANLATGAPFPADQRYDDVTFRSPLSDTASVDRKVVVSGTAPLLPESGSFSAFLLAGADVRLQQVVALPAGEASLTAGWADSWQLASGLVQEPGTGFRVVLRNEQGELLATLFDSAGALSGASARTRDLGAWAGRTVVLSFELRGSWSSRVRIDSVQVRAGSGADLLVNGGFETGDLAGWTAAAAREPRMLASAARTVGPLRVTRTFFSPPDALWGRWADVFENPGTGPVATTVTLYTNLGSDGCGRVYEPAGAGGRALSTWNACAAHRDAALVFGAAAVVGYEGNGTGGPFFREDAGSEEIFLSYELSLPPGGRAALVHFVVLGGSATGPSDDASLLAAQVDAEAGRIVAAFGSDVRLRQGLTAEEAAAVLGF